MRIILSLLLISLIFVQVHAEIEGDSPELIAAIVLYRHGARTPLHYLPASSETCAWPKGPRNAGQLTNLGQVEQYRLGKFYRNRYFEQYHIIGSKYNISEVVIRSSGTDRTVMSAYSNLVGLFPAGTGNPDLPGAVQPAPVVSPRGSPWPRGSDRLLHPESVCPFLKELENATMYSTDWALVEYEYGALMKRLSDDLGYSKILGARDIGEIYDPIHSALFHSPRACPTPDALSSYDWQDLVNLHAKKEHARIGTRGDLRTRITITPLLVEWSSRVESVVESVVSPPFRLAMFSGHDTNVEALLAAFGLWGPNAPEVPFASHVELEVWRIDGELTVSMTHDNQAMFIPECDGVYCTIQQWRDAVSAIVVDFDGYCSASIQVVNYRERWSLASVLWLLFVAAAAIIAVVCSGVMFMVGMVVAPVFRVRRWKKPGALLD